MSKHKITLCLAIVFFTLRLSYPALAQSALAKPGTATVSGRVTLKGEPAPGLAIALQPQQQYYPPNPSTVLRAKTDETGRFRFTGVAAGRHYISAVAPGFSTPSDKNFGPMGKSLSVVSSGGEIIGVDIRYRGERGYVVSGTLTGDEASQQYSGVTVSLFSVSTGALAGSGFFQPREASKGFTI